MGKIHINIKKSSLIRAIKVSYNIYLVNLLIKTSNLGPGMPGTALGTIGTALGLSGLRAGPLGPRAGHVRDWRDCFSLSCP